MFISNAQLQLIGCSAEGAEAGPGSWGEYGDRSVLSTMGKSQTPVSFSYCTISGMTLLLSRKPHSTATFKCPGQWAGQKQVSPFEGTGTEDSEPADCPRDAMSLTITGKSTWVGGSIPPLITVMHPQKRVLCCLCPHGVAVRASSVKLKGVRVQSCEAMRGCCGLRGRELP